MKWLYCIIDNILHCQFKNKNTRLTKYQKKIELSLGLDYRMVNAKKNSTVNFINKKEHNKNRSRVWHFPKFWPKKKITSTLKPAELGMCATCCNQKVQHVRLFHHLTFTLSPSTSTVLIVKSTPIVGPWDGVKNPFANLFTKHVFPTFASPISIILNK